MKTVLLVAEGAPSEDLGAALSAMDWVVRNTSPRDAVEAARSEIPAAIVVAGFGDTTAARYVSHLHQNLRSDCPPLVVSLDRPDAAVRDACIISGASDVSAGGPEDLVHRVDAVTGEWLRGALRVPFAVTVRAQHVRQALDLQAVNLDVSGLGLEQNDVLQEGQLLRMTLVLSGEELLVWARVSPIDDDLGARFIGTSPEDRQRIAAAIQLLRETPSSSRITPVAPAPQPTPTPLGTPLVPGPPPTPTPLGTPLVPGPPPTQSAPPLVRPAPPLMARQTPIAVTPVAPPVATPADALQAPSTLVPEAPTPTANPVVPVAATGPARASLSDAIDDELGTPKAEADLLEQLLGSALVHRWPQWMPEAEASLASLQTAAMMGFAGDEEGAPTADTVLAFVRTISPLERRLFDMEPPPELPDAALGIRCLGLRLRLFALGRDAEEKLAGPDRYAIDDVVIAALKAEVAQLDAGLQKIVDGFVTNGQPQKIKDVSNFRNVLNKAFTDLRRVVARLRGDAESGGPGNAVLLDVAEEAPGQQAPTTVRKDPSRDSDKKVVDKKPKFARMVTPEQKAKRRIVAWSVIGIAALVVRIVTMEPSVKRLDGNELDGLAGVVEIAIPPDATGVDRARPRAAIVHVTATWSGDDVMVSKLKATLRARQVARFTVLGPNGKLMADGRTGPNERVNVVRRRNGK